MSSYSAMPYPIIPPYGDLIYMNSRALSVGYNYVQYAYSVIYSVVVVREREQEGERETKHS